MMMKISLISNLLQLLCMNIFQIIIPNHPVSSRYPGITPDIFTDDDAFFLPQVQPHKPEWCRQYSMIPSFLLKIAAPQIMPCLTLNFQVSMHSSEPNSYTLTGNIIMPILHLFSRKALDLIKTRMDHPFLHY